LAIIIFIIVLVVFIRIRKRTRKHIEPTSDTKSTIPFLPGVQEEPSDQLPAETTQPQLPGTTASITQTQTTPVLGHPTQITTSPTATPKLATPVPAQPALPPVQAQTPTPESKIQKMSITLPSEDSSTFTVQLPGTTPTQSTNNGNDLKENNIENPEGKQS
jgi:hypothetical protein